MNKIRIPKSFQLLGKTITVKFEPGLAHSYNWNGSADYTKDVIKLMPNTESHPKTQANIEQTFFHELLHLCCNEMEEDELRQNEKFITVLAGLLHQAFKTAEYEA